MIIKKVSYSVLVFGTFDCGVHPGHLFFLKKAKEFGDTLCVMLSRDDNAFKLKNRKTVFSYKDRCKQLLNTGIVNKVYEEDDYKNWVSLKKINPDFIILGHDQLKWKDVLFKVLKIHDAKCAVKVISDTYNRAEYNSTNLSDVITKKLIKNE